MKILKSHGFLWLVKLDKPVMGGLYAVMNGGQITDGLCLDAANDLYKILLKLSR